MRGFSSRQKRQKGGQFLPQAALPPKEGGAMKQGDFIVIATSLGASGYFSEQSPRQVGLPSSIKRWQAGRDIINRRGTVDGRSSYLLSDKVIRIFDLTKIFVIATEGKQSQNYLFITFSNQVERSIMRILS